MRGKDHGRIGFRIRTPPRDGNIRFRSLNALDLLRLSGVAPNIHTKLPSTTGHAAFEDDVIRIEVVDPLDTFLHLGHGETPPPIDIQNADQQSVDLVGNRKNGGKETGGVLEIGVKGGIVEGGRLPWITTSEKIEENDAEGPDIIEQGRI